MKTPALALALWAFVAPAIAPAQDVRDSVVKVIVTYRAPDTESPWSKQSPEEITGTGFVIEGERILTTGYVAEHASRVLIQPEGSSDKYTCEVEHIATGEDLAVLRVKNKSRAAEFFEGREPIEIVTELPKAGDRVEVYGFPIGGEQMSVTKGVISRFEYGYIFNFVQGLMIQIDAAINQGNFGGPAVIDGRSVGIVHMSDTSGENIGYIIAGSEIRSFLDDIGDGAFDGRHRAAFNAHNAVNETLRDRLGVPDDVEGVLFAPDPNAPGLDGGLRKGDIITRIGRYDVDNEGNIDLRDDIRIRAQYAIDNEGGPDGLDLVVWRDGEAVDVTVPSPQGWPYLLGNIGSDYPPYMIYGPVVFTKAYADYVNEYSSYYLGMVGSPMLTRSLSPPAFEGEELVVVVSPFFSHECVDGYDPLNTPTLKSVNGEDVRNLAHLVEILRDHDEEFVVFEWHDRFGSELVLRSEDMRDVTEEILDNNGIRRQMSPELQDIWDAD